MNRMDGPRHPKVPGAIARVARAVAVVAVSAAALSACGSLLGIEKLPVVDDAGSTPEVDAGEASAADAGCEVSSRVCGCVVHDFCDDFDVDGEALAARWSGALGAPNPFTKGDASVAFTTKALSPPRAIQTASDEPKESAVALIAHQLDFAALYPGKDFVGFRYTVNIQLDTLVLTERGGPVPDAGSALAAAVINYSGLDATGVGLVFTSDGAYVVIARGLFLGGALPDSGDGALSRIYLGDPVSFAKTWLRAELLVADKARAIREGFSSCGAVADGTVAAASLGPGKLSQGCLAMPAGVGSAWAKQPGVTAGAAMMASGTLVLRQDDVAFDFLPP